MGLRTGGPVRRIGCGVLDKSGVRDDQVDYHATTWSLVWLLRGAGTYTDDCGRVLSLTAGDVFQRWPDQAHSTRCDPDSGWLEIYLDLGRDLAEALADVGMLRRDLLVWHLGVDPSRLQRWCRLRESLRMAHDRELPRWCLQVQQEAMAAMEPTLGDEAGQDLIDDACRHLAESAAKRDDLQGFCRDRGLSYEAFRKRFQRRTGLAPGQYRIRRRLERACALLQTTSLSIGAIAAQLGYVSPFEFSAQFRRHLGQSPRRYRGR
jgi:AraC-like DNA-binding protein